MKRLTQTLAFCLLTVFTAVAQKNYVSEVWVSDLGNGKYKNPVLYADYSDPDACRVGDDFYMTSSRLQLSAGIADSTFQGFSELDDYRSLLFPMPSPLLKHRNVRNTATVSGHPVSATITESFISSGETRIKALSW